MNENLVNYILQLADNALILGHRNSEWCGHGPVLEQDIAISNISLDLIGQARNFYQYAASLKGDGTTEDSFAYFRDSPGFKNILLVEQPKGDWAITVVRQFFFSAHQQVIFEQLGKSKDSQLAAIANKSLKEIAYHLRWSSEWVIRLGDGTGESHQRAVNAVESIWTYTGEIFKPAHYELPLISEGIAADLSISIQPWMKKVKAVFDEAGLSIPKSALAPAGGKEGVHTKHLDEVLKELQSVARAHPTALW